VVFDHRGWGRSDVAAGKPRHESEPWEQIRDDDGRVADLYTGELGGTYRLRFDTAYYFAAHGLTGFYPEVVITFEIADAAANYHVPLLLSPYAYSTYRGS
jgi:5-hydroxyisourate hydrolase